MIQDPGALHSTLSAAVGDDLALMAELRHAFLASAAMHTDALGRARCDANWRMAAMRLQGLAASFGAIELMRAAATAAEGVPHDPVALRRARRALEAFDG